MARTAGSHQSTPAAGASRPSRKIPAFTIVAEWRKALAGVGAAIAPGSQAWKGTWADFVIAPTRTSAQPIPESGAAATSSEMRHVPASPPSTMSPARRARPPAPVTRAAWRAADRAEASRSSWPMRRYDETVVSSQNTKTVRRWSETTSPIIDPAKNVMTAANRAVDGRSGMYREA